MSFSTIAPDPDPTSNSLFDPEGNINSIQWNNLIKILLGTSTDQLPNYYPLKTANDSSASANLSANQTVQLFSYTGKGMIMITVVGDGVSATEINYQADGGSVTLVTTSDQRLLVPIVFEESLVISATNTTSSTASRSTVYSQGTYQ